MVHHLAQFPRRVRHAFLTIEYPRLRRAIAEMLHLPTFLVCTMEATRRRGLDAMLAESLRKPLPPPLEIRFSWVQSDPVEASGFDREVHMGMRGWMRTCR